MLHNPHPIDPSVRFWGLVILLVLLVLLGVFFGPGRA